LAGPPQAANPLLRPEGNTRLPLHVIAVESRPINPIYGRPVRHPPPQPLLSFE